MIQLHLYANGSRAAIYNYPGDRTAGDIALDHLKNEGRWDKIVMHDFETGKLLVEWTKQDLKTTPGKDEDND